MAGLAGLLDSPVVQLGVSTLVVFGVQRLVPTFKPDWYKSLRKPTWTPPNYVFPMVWIPLKLMQSVALWMTYRAGIATGDNLGLVLPLGVFGIHLFLGNWWNVVFFGQHKLKESLGWMYAFWLSIAGCAAAFRPLSPVAGALMLPTLVWVTIAAQLNREIVQLNADKANVVKK